MAAQLRSSGDKLVWLQRGIAKFCQACLEIIGLLDSDIFSLVHGLVKSQFWGLLLANLIVQPSQLFQVSAQGRRLVLAWLLKLRLRQGHRLCYAHLWKRGQLVLWLLYVLDGRLELGIFQVLRLHIYLLVFWLCGYLCGQYCRFVLHLLLQKLYFFQ